MTVFDIDIGNNSQQILPVPIESVPVQNVEYPVDYGSSPYQMPLRPSSRKNDDSQYCNFLQPSPRNQALNVPYEGNKNCPKFKAQPFQKDSCYLIENSKQGVPGIVCNQAGGSDNANFIRGNQFGTDYPFNFNEQMEKKKLEYTVEKPVQLLMENQNPMILYNKSTFYPSEHTFLRKNKDYITYPLKNNYTKNGIPTYRYPYKVMNPELNIDNSKRKYLEPNYRGMISKNNNKNNKIKKLKKRIIEEFNSKYDSDDSYLKHIILYLFILIVLIVIIYFMFTADP
jgi:hypothetical protein